MRSSRWLLALGLLVFLPADAGINVWTSGGPYGGNARVVVSPARSSRLYAVTYGRLFRSDDGGAAWTELMGVPSDRIVPDVTDPALLYAPGYRSTDAGATWSGNGIPNLGYFRLAEWVVDPRRPASQYATLQAHWLHSTTGAIIRTTDGGATWAGIRGNEPYGGLLLDATDPDTILTVAYLGSRYPWEVDTSQFVKTTDGGKTWRATFKTAGLVGSLTADPRDPRIVYATGSSGTLRSTDRGDTWVKLTDMPSGTVVVDPGTSAVYVLTANGLLKGPDWTPVDFGPDLPAREGVGSLTFDPGDAAIRYAGVYPYGVLKSVDDGASYAPANRGLTGLAFASVAVSPASPGTLFATGGSVFRSDDAGASWRTLPGGPVGNSVGSLVVDPGAPGTVYVADSTSIHRTTDGGASWATVLANLPLLPKPPQLLLDPRAPSTVYVADGDLWRSTDRGATWVSRQVLVPPGTRGSAGCLDIDPSGSTLYAGLTYAGWGVLKSTDAGDTWSAARAGLPVNNSIDVVLVDRASPATLFATTSIGSTRGLFRSTDGGVSWIPIGAALGARGATVTALLQDPDRPGTLHAATTAGVFRSPDRGLGWNADGLDGVGVYGLAYDASTFTLHAGTQRGLYVRTAQNPVPRLTGLSPVADGKGNGGLTLTVTGSDFVDGSVVLWNGAPRATSPLSGTELAATISGDDTSSAGTAQVTVSNPAPGGGTSTPLPFTILDHLPSPSISSLSPESIASSAPSFELHVTGGDFSFRSQVTWNGAPRPTRLLSPTEVSASIRAEDVSAPGTLAVAVTTPGGGTTHSLPFVVTSHTVSRLVPIVLDVTGRTGVRYTSELTLVNRGASPATLELTYTPSADLGATGGGAASETLPARRQIVLPDVLEHLRQLGLAIPREGAQGGTLALVFRGLAGPDVGYAAVRVTSASGKGKAGVAMPALGPDDLLVDAGFVFGLREDAAARSNLALVNAATSGEVTLRVTLVRDDGRDETALAPATLAPGEWRQLTSPLTLAGYAAGWARIERVSGPGPYFAYGVVNDAVTNDGSVIPAVRNVPPDSTIPVVVRSDHYESELVLGNPADAPLEVTLRARPPATPVTVTLAPRQQKVIPRVLDLLLGPDPPASFASGLRVTGRLLAGPIAGVHAAARTTTVGSSGAYGVFTPAVRISATREAWVYGLRNDAEVRSNLAAGSAVDLRLSVELYSGETGNRAATLGPLLLSGNAPEWRQLDSPLEAFPMAHGWARVVNDSPTGTFYAYGVLNDNGTNDGSYLPMAIGGP